MMLPESWRGAGEWRGTAGEGEVVRLGEDEGTSARQNGTNGKDCDKRNIKQGREGPKRLRRDIHNSAEKI